MGTVKFAGSVSAEVAAGETVTLIVTKPDGTTETLTTTTLVDGSYELTKTYAVAGQYSFVAHVDADAEFDKADSQPAPFTINLAPRTITATATVT